MGKSLHDVRGGDSTHSYATTIVNQARFSVLQKVEPKKLTIREQHVKLWRQTDS